ncbi:MAG: 16S rRNA (cytosine(967)-C(5))-methyltransferase RsmB [Faecalibacterium sp.]|jgi:16S rRNA (cytosine967-C5)-methyltransferase|nr:16S rRNA (cytosine(967)-C(5))-methyltransferase RsmB [Faecalibacterium sp.]
MTARYLAVQALLRVEQGGYANLVLDAECKKHPLPPADRAFASAVFYAVLEHRNTLDFILNHFLKKPVEKLDAPVRAILRSGLVQMRNLRTPPSAAVNEAVKLARAFGVSSASGLVNAVLRRAGEFDLAAATFSGPVERLMILGSVSRPVAEHFWRCYPEHAEAILMAAPQAGAVTTAIRANTLRTTPQALANALAKEGVQAVPQEKIPGCLLAAFHGSPAETKAFGAGLFHVQGIPSQLAALALQAKPGCKVIDLCAAPGGKTLTIAQQMHDEGKLFSCDVSENRVSLIRTALAREKITCAEALCSDAAKENAALAGADFVLADVPCSGLGILKKKPDIRYKTLESVPQLVILQRAILENAAKCLQKGGRLVYSTCTLNPDENERQIESFLHDHPEFHVHMPDFVPDDFCRGPFGALSLPDETGLDGFFLCAMEKR